MTTIRISDDIIENNERLKHQFNLFFLEFFNLGNNQNLDGL